MMPQFHQVRAGYVRKKGATPSGQWQINNNPYFNSVQYKQKGKMQQNWNIPTWSGPCEQG